MKTFLTLSLLFLFAPLAWAQQIDTANISNRIVVINAVNKTNGTKTNVDIKGLKLKVKTVTTHHEKLDELLRTNGVFPDGESFNLVLQLNPFLNDIAATENSTIIIPVLAQSNASRTFLTKNLIAITNDYELKATILKLSLSIDHLVLLDSTLLNVPPESVDQIKNIANILDVVSAAVKERNHIIDVGMLKQITAEASFLDSLLQKKSLSNNQSSIKSIADNMQVRSFFFDESKGPGNTPEPYPQVRLSVRVVNINGKPINGLRINLVPPALFGLSANYLQMPIFSSPATGKYPVANYKIWASRPGTFDPVSDIFPLELRKQENNKPMELELAIK